MLRLEDALIIGWTLMPTYNPIVSVAAGAGLLNIVWMGLALGAIAMAG